MANEAAGLYFCHPLDGLGGDRRLTMGLQDLLYLCLCRRFEEVACATIP